MLACKKRRIFKYTGETLAALFSVCCGIIGAFGIMSVLAILHIASGGIVIYCIAGFIGLIVALSNYFRLYRVTVPAVLIEIFGGEKIFKDFFFTEQEIH